MSQRQPNPLLVGDHRRLARKRPEQLATRTKRQAASALAVVPLFADLSRRDLARLAKHTDELSFEPGRSIVEEGAPGEALFVVLSGHAKVMRGGRKVGDLYPGDFFGELSALDGGPRTATVRAETPIHVLRLFRHTLVDLLERDPRLSMKLLDGVVRRVRQVEGRGRP